MSIICNNCGHDNQDDALFCDECGEELTNYSLSTSTVEEETTISEESYGEVSSNEIAFNDYPSAEISTNEPVSDENPYGEISTSELAVEKEPNAEVSTSEAVSEEVAEESLLDSVAVETEEVEQSPSPLPIGAATRLELDEPPIQKIISPPTTLELPTAVLINQETEEKFILPLEEKTVYIGRLNEEFPVHIDLSAIPNADLISRVHAAIHLENEIYYLEDAGSSNGTWLNEQQVKTGSRFRQQLNPGDTIAFGRNQTVKFTFDVEDS